MAPKRDDDKKPAADKTAAAGSDKKAEKTDKADEKKAEKAEKAEDKKASDDRATNPAAANAPAKAEAKDADKSEVVPAADVTLGEAEPDPNATKRAFKDAKQSASAKMLEEISGIATVSKELTKKAAQVVLELDDKTLTSRVEAAVLRSARAEQVPEDEVKKHLKAKTADAVEKVKDLAKKAAK